jgi:hypothetical protein
LEGSNEKQEMAVSWHRSHRAVEHDDLRVQRDRRMPYMGFGMSPEGCAEFQFAQSRCDIWVSADFPPPAFVMEHERQHCAGFEHAGETELRQILAKVRAPQRAPQERDVSASQGASVPRGNAL